MSSPRLRAIERQFAKRQSEDGELERLVRELIRQALAEQQQPERQPARSPRLRALLRQADAHQLEARAKLAESHLPPFVPLADRQPYPSVMGPVEPSRPMPPAPLQRQITDVKVKTRDALGRISKIEAAGEFSAQVVQRTDTGRISMMTVTPEHGYPCRLEVKRDATGKILSIQIGAAP